MTSLPFLQTVAIADDEPLIVALLTAVLKDAGYEVVGAAANGQEAVQLVAAKKPNVLLLDVHMPVMDGLQALAQINALGMTAVVMLTGDASPEVARQAMDLGAAGYARKPVDASTLPPMLETAWHHFQKEHALGEKNRELQETLEVRKLIEKAKGILMEQQGFTEDEAHKCLVRMSQDQGLAMKEVCRSVIQVRMVLGAKAPAVKNRRAA
jgi:two-component system, response regulator PdtaR